MKGKLFKFILVASLLLNGSIIVAAVYFYCRDSGCWRPGSRLEFRRGADLAGELGLTPEQQEILQDRDAAFRNSLKETREEVIKKRRALLELLRADEPDRKVLDDRLSEITTLQKRIQILVVDHILEERRVLTKEQQVKYIELLKDQCEIEKFYGKGKKNRWR